MNSTRPKILAVDDDPAMLRLVSQWLTKAGYHVQQAGDGFQALAAIEANCPDFLITDWEMPRLDGVELCRKVRQLKLPHYIYILFLTVKTAPDELVQGLEVGADDFLTKPVNRDELLARLRAGSRILELERRLSEMARTDPLTGLITSRTFYDCLQKEWERAERLHLPMSCVMLDLDFFKRINDTHGHPAGDLVLKETARLLTDSCRGEDSICRYGGEEFCVLLPETTEHDAALWAERARKRMASMVLPIRGQGLHITGSFGVAQRHDDTQTPEDLIDQADQTLLCAKQSGRDRVIRFEQMSDASDIHLEHPDDVGKLFHGVAAQHVMSPLVVCLREDDTIGQGAEFFLRLRINSAPVVNAKGKMTGILSEKDLMAAMVSLDCWQRPIHEVMKPNVICYEEDTPIRTIYEFLCRVSIRRVVIVKDGHPTGTISRGTLLRWFRNLVITSGLLESEQLSEEAADLNTHGAQQRLAQTARELAQQASCLEQHLQEETDDLVPYVVGGATRIQELVTDLLAYSRFANETGGAAAALKSALLTDDPLD